MNQTVFIDFRDPYFIVFFQPNKVTEHHLRELRIPGPPYQMRQDLSLIRDANIKLTPDWTEGALNKIKDMMLKNSDEEKHEYKNFMLQLEDVFHTTPRKVQLKGLWQLYKNQYHGLNFEQGLGKTKIVLDFFVYLKKYNNPEYKLFVTCPNGNVMTWAHEVKKHQPMLRVIPLHSGTKNKMKALKQPGDVYVTNIEGIAPVKGHKGIFLRALADKFATGIWFGVVDESTTIKGKSKRTKVMHNLRDLFARRSILTGTFLPNGAKDAWGQLTFLDAGATGFSSYYGFEKHFCEHGNPYVPQMIDGYRNEDQLKAVMEKWTTRATKEDWLDIPDKVYKRVYFSISSEQRKALDDLEKACYAEFTDENDNLIEINKAHVLARIESYRQVIKGFSTVTTVSVTDGKPKINKEVRRFKHRPRYECLKDLLKGELKGYPTIIWTNHIEERKLVMEMFKSEKFEKYEELSNKWSNEQVQEIINKFQSGLLQYLVISLQSFCTGITITAAKATVYCSNTKDWYHRAQSEDRVHRMGLEHPALMFDILAENTEDEKILECLENKSDFASEFIDGIRRKFKR